MSFERNLLLVHQPGCQDIRDFETISNFIREMAPDIEPFVLNNEHLAAVTRRQAARRPTLVFSPGPLGTFRPDRGTIAAGQPIPKLDQMRLFAKAGLPVPAFAELTPEFRPSEEVFGPYVILKPGFIFASKSVGMALMRTHRVSYRPMLDYPAEHPGRFGPMIVQSFVDTGNFYTHARVLTLFGEPLLATDVLALNPRPPLTLADEELERLPVTAKQAGEFRRRLVFDSDILDLARKVHGALPDIPLQGCDIVREASTGKLFILEANPGGNTWFFSNNLANDIARGVGLANLSEQFDAFRTAARVLVEQTRLQAA